MASFPSFPMRPWLRSTFRCATTVAVALSNLSFPVVGQVGPTFVDDDISQDSVWKYPGDYVIVGRPRILQGASLTIEPGVNVRFSKDSALVVEGGLLATGTQASPISFSTNVAVPAPGDYDSIVLNPMARTVLQHCEVRYAKAGVTIGESTGSVLVEACRFSDNSDAGVRITRSDLGSVTVGTNSFSNSPFGLVAIADSLHGGKISGNSFGAHPDVSLLLQSSGKISGEGVTNEENGRNLEVSSNVIAGPTAIGIHVDVTVDQRTGGDYGAYAVAKLSSVVIRDNKVSGTTADAILVSGTSTADTAGWGKTTASLDLSQTEVANNSIVAVGNGIRVWGATPSADEVSLSISGVRIANNSIVRATDSGIVVGGRAYARNEVSASFRDLTIAGNTVLSPGKSGILVNTSDVRRNLGTLDGLRIVDNKAADANEEGISISGKTSSSAEVKSNVLVRNRAGVRVGEWALASLDGNEISSNRQEGLSFSASKGSSASRNDIAGNRIGLRVSGASVVGAENNFWGSESGPRHDSINPSGTGNSVVVADGEVDFIPWLFQEAVLAAEIPPMPTTKEPSGCTGDALPTCPTSPGPAKNTTEAPASESHGVPGPPAVVTLFFVSLVLSRKLRK